MNRILRPTLSICALRACLFILSILSFNSVFSQVTIDDCPETIVNVMADPMASCQGNLILSPEPSTTSAGATVTWYSIGANVNGTPTGRLPMSMLATTDLNFGLSQVYFVADDGISTASCSTSIFVSEEANLPVDACDDIIVDFQGGCMAEALALDEVVITTDLCDPGSIDLVRFSWSSSADEQTLIVDPHGGSPSFYSLYLRKYRNGSFIRQVSCDVQVSITNLPVPAITCPSDVTLEVAPSCMSVYTYDVEGASTLPCGGSIVMTQAGGGPSGTPLAAGSFTYAYQLQEVGTGLDFDGTDDIVTVPYDPALNITDDITVETWVWINAYSGDWVRLVGKGTAGLARTYGLWIRADGYLLWQNGNAAASGFEELYGPIIPTGQWVHVAGVRRGTTYETYVNGVLSTSGTYSGSAYAGDASPLTLGYSPGIHAHLNGSLDDVKMWNIARTPEQILSDANDCYGGVETGLVAYYNFEDGTGSSSLSDLSGNGFTGTLENMDPSTDWGQGIDNCVTSMGAEPCSWTVTVEESTEVGTQMNCVGHINVSIDGNCMATIDASTLLSGNLCTDIGSLLISAPGFDPAPSITFTEEHVGMEFDVTVQDPNGINSCWGTVLVEDKLAPIIMCPADEIVLCTMPTDTAATGIPILLSARGMYTDLQTATISNGLCEAELFFRDAVLNNLCNGIYQQVISRTFYAVDNAGNMSEPCVQTISVEREILDNATYPPHWDGLATHIGIEDNGVLSNPPLACEGVGTAWAADTLEDGRIVPSPFDQGLIPGTGAPGDVGSCGTIFSFYEDIYLDICNDGCESNFPSFKVLRTWDVFDWCTGEFRLHEQIIKVLDTVPPVFTTAVPDLTVSTDLWGCGATIYLPTVEAVDQCSKDIKYTWSVTGGTYNPVSGTVHVPSVALTTPGNEILLIAAAEDCCGNIAVDTGLVTIIDNVVPVVVADEHTVVTLNNQSDDGATKVYADSFDDGSFDGCGPIDFWVRRMDKACVDYDGLDGEGKDDPSEIDELNDFHKYVHFCCDDTEEDQMIVFMVCDDADRDGIAEMNGDDNCNTAMILVDVQDKLAPTIVCPADKTINCIDFVVFEDFIGTTLDDEQMEFLNAQFGVAYSNSTCGELGMQTFDGDDFCGEGTADRVFIVTSSTGTATCTQEISIIAEAQNVLTCDRISFPTLSLAPYNYDWCDPSDDVTPNVTPVQVTECGAVNIEQPVIDIDNLCTEVGINLTLDTFNFAGGACMKILAHWEVIDQCLFIENFLHDDGIDEIDPFVNENGYYEIYVEYDIFDTKGPDMSCEDIEVATTDCVRNYDTFSISATDDCTAPDIISYSFKVDIGNNGEFEYPADGSYAEGNSFDASIEAIGGLEIGTHAIKWLTHDGCGNYSTCHQEITVGKQVKAPTPYCHLGLSSAVMDSIYGCSVEIWATDFVAGGEDDCDATLTYLMIPYQDIYGDPADETDDLSFDDAKDMAMANWTFDCKYIENGEAHVIELRIYAVDEDGRYDFCDASLTLNDNFDCCEDIFGISSSIAGNVATEEGMLVENVSMNIMSDKPEFPRVQNTSKEGNYMFTSLPYETNYEITASNNENTKDGVSTLDLVLIQRHILGITTLDSPFKLIAADINNNEAISAADLLQLRKLILGIYADDKLPNNESWRFVDNSYEFVDATKPFPFVDMVEVNQLSHAMYNQNFVAVKVGDVNGSVSASIAGNAQVRSNENFEMMVDDASYEAGDLVKVDFTSSEVSSLYGYQFTFDFSNSLTLKSITSGDLEINVGNYSLNGNSIAISWNEAELVSIAKEKVLFTVEFEALASGKLSETTNISDKVLVAESYDSNLNVNGVALNFRSLENEAFALLQNEPNPFNGTTQISFVLPDAGNANLKVYDVTGKTILSKSENFAKGMNTVILDSRALSASGVLYYQLTYGNNSATRKMVLLD